MLKWARERECPWHDVSTCASAAAGGHLEVLRWLRQHGCEWDADTCRCAARRGHLVGPDQIWALYREFGYFLGKFATFQAFQAFMSKLLGTRLGILRHSESELWEIPKEYLVRP